MSHKKRAYLTTSPEGGRDLRPFLRRVFWKGERRAERDLTRDARGLSTDRPARDTVEDLIRQVDTWPFHADSATLWVPDRLTLSGDAVAQDVAMAVLGGKLLGLNHLPDGSSSEQGGRLHRLVRE